jgi:hypothetical protein
LKVHSLLLPEVQYQSKPLCSHDICRSLAYQCLDLLRASLNNPNPQTPAAAAAAAVVTSSHPTSLLPQHSLVPDTPAAAAAAESTPATLQQQLRSSKRSHQLTALLNWVAAGITTPPQQLPAAAAVLAAEASLLLAAPAAAMHNTVDKLLLRQPALDTAGLPLFGRIMAGGGSSLNSNSKSSKGGAGGVKGAAAVMAERQWLMRLLWLGLRVSLCIVFQVFSPWWVQHVQPVSMMSKVRASNWLQASNTHLLRTLDAALIFLFKVRWLQRGQMLPFTSSLVV